MSRDRLLGVAVLVVVAPYRGATTTTTTVLLRADRVGNQLAVDSDVKVPGLVVGWVSAELPELRRGITALADTTIESADLGPSTGCTARFTDATGLAEGDDVRVAGVRVGRVDGVRVVDQRGRGRSSAEVAFSLTGERSLPASTTAAIEYRDLVGRRYLALEQGAGPVGEALPPGGGIPLERTRPALALTALFTGFKPLFQELSPEEVNRLSTRIAQVLQGEGGTVDALLRHTASLTSTLASRDRVVGEAISALGDLASTTAGFLDEARPPLRTDIANLGLVAATLGNGRWFDTYLCGLLPPSVDLGLVGFTEEGCLPPGVQRTPMGGG
ncbi:MCE family protein [Actinosynnema mirum]|uniref:Mammalian cell entry related domain protein n=1 Tax=Actinosynnema mirum (strain ATCC 29888 / DSM 43827 / JCM 3225 / NBRC 14064 / NCIMB 13271 / NRRL B-12336 / IMRU 3971 / 101) TaxID=446462 RepID=C6WN65_ACTMD|nr:MCE family protein [Actinosynnema mirum]ACU40429.1 Mammalian cell entry related domain protein [Actinosynnema mirum DSM 43827]